MAAASLSLPTPNYVLPTTSSRIRSPLLLTTLLPSKPPSLTKNTNNPSRRRFPISSKFTSSSPQVSRAPLPRPPLHQAQQAPLRPQAEDPPPLQTPPLPHPPHPFQMPLLPLPPSPPLHPLHDQTLPHHLPALRPTSHLDPPLSVRLTPAASSLALQESLLKSQISSALATKLHKLLMLSSHRRLLLSKLSHLAPDLGLPPNFRPGLCNEFPQRFRTVESSYGRALEPVSWDPERRACAVVREVLSLTVEKRTLVDHLTHFRKEFGHPNRLWGMLLRHPDMFYVSIKGQRDSVFLMEAYDSDGKLLLGEDDLLVAKKRLMELVSEGKKMRRWKRNHVEGVDDVIEDDEEEEGEGEDCDDDDDHSLEELFDAGIEDGWEDFDIDDEEHVEDAVDLDGGSEFWSLYGLRKGDAGCSSGGLESW